MRSEHEDAKVLASKAHRKTVTLSTIVSILAICGVVLPIAGAVMSPWAIGYMSDAMAGEIQEQVKRQLTPINAGMKTLIEANIAQLEDDISQLEYRKENMPQSWTSLDAQTLTNKARRLRSNQQALAAIVAAETAQPRN